jgi:hypothetical protein
MTRETIGIWMAAIGTLACYSYLYKDNFIFQIMEHVFIGIAAGHAVTMGFYNIRTMAWNPLVREGTMGWLVALILGVMLYTRFFKNISWLSRYPIAFMMGVGAAVTITGNIEGQFIRQLRATMVPITSLDTLIIFIGVVGTVTYFLFGPASNNKVAKNVAVIGMWTMMGAFGAAYGNTVMARMSLVIGRLQFLFGTWIPIIK